MKTFRLFIAACEPPSTTANIPLVDWDDDARVTLIMTIHPFRYKSRLMLRHYRAFMFIDVFVPHSSSQSFC